MTTPWYCVISGVALREGVEMVGGYGHRVCAVLWVKPTQNGASVYQCA